MLSDAGRLIYKFKKNVLKFYAKSDVHAIGHNIRRLLISNNRAGSRVDLIFRSELIPSVPTKYKQKCEYLYQSSPGPALIL